MRAFLIALMTFALAFSSAFAEEAGQQQAAPATVDELRARIGEVLDETGAVGVGLALVERDRVIWAGGIGLADREAVEAATADTVFRIGSITKAFVGLMALMLVEDGVLDLDAPLRELAPEVEFENPWADTDPIRIVHLLEHTTGWDDLALKDYALDARPPFSLRQGIDFNPEPRRSRWRPGTSMSYSNAGPPVAAYVMEKLTGRDFEDLVQERIFDPLGMRVASFHKTDAVSGRLAKGYEGDRVVDYWNISMRPSGSINASAKEMASFVQLFLRGGRAGDAQLLTPDSIARMETAVSTRAARAGVTASYGLNNYTMMSEGFVFHGHNGGMPGYLAEFGYARDLGVGYAFMLNASNWMAMIEIGDLVRAFLTADLEPPPLPPVATIGADLLESYAGWYEPITPRPELVRFAMRILGLVHVEAIDGALEAAPFLGESVKLVPMAEGLFRAEEDPLASVAFYSGKDAGIATLGTGYETRRVSSALAWIQIVVTAVSILSMVSAVVFALIWVPRWLFGSKLREIGFIGIRALPTLTVALLLAALLCVAIPNPILVLGEPTTWSVSFWFFLILFALSAPLGLVHVVRNWSAPVNAFVRVHALLVAASSVVVAAYLLYWGVIGWRPWT